jgi:hypothetical protein
MSGGQHETVGGKGQDVLNGIVIILITVGTVVVTCPGCEILTARVTWLYG